MNNTSWFAKLAELRRAQEPDNPLTWRGSAMTLPESTDTPTVAAVKLAASMMDLLKLIGRSSNSHMLGSALYAPLVASDLMEAHRQRRGGRSGMLPALAGGALAVMMAQHAAPMLQHAMKRPAVQQLLTRIGVGAK
jgi:hypothetical protein